MYKVATVCTGNICRSPMAEYMIAEALRGTDLEAHVSVESYATSDWEAGNPMDRRAQAWLRDHGIGDATQIGRHTSHPITPEQIQELDLILALDVDHLTHLEKLAAVCPDDQINKPTIRLLGSFNPELADASREEQGIFDPWFGGDQDFETVGALIRPCIDGVIDFIRRDRVARSILNVE